MKIIYQQDEKDCGVTCIAMVLSNYKTVLLQSLKIKYKVYNPSCS
ncbi:cysteine peptidase family C39 domain-containing protein [Lactococcus lactis]